MSVENNLLQKSFEAGDIFTEAFAVCKLGSTANVVNLPTSDGDSCIGVVQEITTVASGQAVPVMLYGITKVIAGGVVAIGDHVGAKATTGHVYTLTGSNTDRQVGIALSAATADGDIISMLLTPGGFFAHVGVSSPSSSLSSSISSSKSPSISPSPSA